MSDSVQQGGSVQQGPQGPGPAGGAYVEEDEINLGQLFRTVWRGKWWIALTTTIAILIGGYYAYGVAVPVYTANSVVALESREEQVTDLANVVSGLGGDQATIRRRSIQK